MTRLPAHPRFLGSALVAILVFAIMPTEWRVNSRLLIAWDTGVACYLVLAWIMAVRSSTDMMQKRAAREDVGAVAVLVLTLAAAVASLAAIAVELQDIHDDPASQQVFWLSIVVVTILCSWFFVHTIYAIHYAHEYYGDAGDAGKRQGLKFPNESKPDYCDFLYFSFNFGVAGQTSDVAIISKRMRRLALAHTIFSFLFNTTILALAINIGAGLL
jgi:uncharacterized membrane protein